jgi:hypothetical protein
MSTGRVSLGRAGTRPLGLAMPDSVDPEQPVAPEEPEQPEQPVVPEESEQPEQPEDLGALEDPVDRAGPEGLVFGGVGVRGLGGGGGVGLRGVGRVGRSGLLWLLLLCCW